VVVGVVVVGAAGAGDAIGVAAGAVEAPGDAIGVADAAGDAIGVADAAGDALGVACAITLCPMFPGDAWPDGAATAESPKLATMSEVRTPVLSRFNVASLDLE
jgi:hypothetical protein